MIALAVADRPLVRELIQAGQLSVDFVETSGPQAQDVRQALPSQRCLLHNSIWNWSLAHPDALGQQDVMPITHSLIEQLAVPWFSLHLGFSAATVAFAGWMQPSSPLVSETLAFERIVRHLRTMAQQLPVPLLIENLDYNPGGAYEYVCHPAFIADVVREAEVLLLLDLAHARVSAQRLGLTIERYLELLPLDRVRQLHISGPRWIDGVLTDVHEPLADADYALLETILSRTQPWALTLEYGKEAAPLKHDLARLSALLHGSSS